MDITPHRQESALTHATENKIDELIRVLGYVNQLVAYPKPDAELRAWAVTILNLSPKFDTDKLRFVMREFQACNIMWNKDMGIQNIIVHLKRVVKTESGYEFTEKIKP